jgi:hypothetical protein
MGSGLRRMVCSQKKQSVPLLHGNDERPFTEHIPIRRHSFNIFTRTVSVWPAAKVAGSFLHALGYGLEGLCT